MTKTGAILALACSFLTGVRTASAQVVEAEVSVHTSYIDIGSFNDRFSNTPVGQLTLALNVGNGFYLEPYIYSGFQRPLNDESSEYGLEVGWEGEIASGWTLNTAGGRWANYQGAGADAGDWFARVGFGHGDLSVSASVLAGDSDTMLLNAEYEVRLRPGLNMTPSVAYVTADGTFNPGVEVSYRVAERIALSARLIAPERPEGREVYGSIGLVLSSSPN